MEKNVGGTDRTVRAVLAVTFAVVGLLALQRGRRSVGVFAAIAAVGMAINAVTCFCGLNKALGIDTTDNSE